MLVATVLTLQPITPVRLPVSHGRFAYTAALELFLRRDAALAKALHEARPHKPFTVSPLLGAQEREGNEFCLHPEQVYTWRLTGLTKKVSEHLLSFTPNMGGVRIGDAVFSIVNVATTAEEHPEAGQDDYIALWERWGKVAPPDSVTLLFLTPTTFRVNHFEQPFPLPRWVFGSLIALWDAFSPYPIGQGMRELIEEAVILSNWRGETRRVELGNHRTVGFIGKFTYRFAERLPELSRLIGMLAEFAFYAGVGWHTAHGMGQTRWIRE
jgi:CRISPR-associated endoribonuclease Cas6